VYDFGASPADNPPHQESQISDGGFHEYSILEEYMNGGTTNPEARIFEKSRLFGARCPPQVKIPITFSPGR
jgi:hypothetical protein